MTAKQPDLSDARQYAEAVAYGKLLAICEVLDALHKERPRMNPWHYDLDAENGWIEDGAVEQIGYTSGYDRAVQTVKAIRLGVEKP